MKFRGNLRLFFWLFLSVIYAVTEFSQLMVVGFGVYVLFVLINSKGKFNSIDSALSLIVYSIIIPNNYVVIVVIDLLAVVCILYRVPIKRKSKKGNRVLVLLAILTVYALLNGFIHSTPLSNYIWIFFYYSPLYSSIVILRRISFDTNNVSVIELLKETVVIQIAWVIVYAITHYHIVLTADDLDWVSGTFGYKQGNVLFIYCAYCSFIFLYHYLNNHDKSVLIFAVASVLLPMSTGSIGLTLFYFSSLGILLLLNQGIKLKDKIYVTALGLFAIAFIVVLNPEWVINDLLRMFDYNALMNKVKKYEVYEQAFFYLPSSDILNALFGFGLAQGSSRASLTGTGLYIQDISEYVIPYQSELFTVYILPYLEHYLSGELGLAAAPIASILSVQLELGYIGTTLLFVIIFQLFYKKNYFVQTICFFELLILFWDNYLEYAKPLFIFALAFSYFTTNTHKKNDWPLKICKRSIMT